MKLPLSLLKSFLTTNLSVQKIAETLTLLGIEVDHIFHEKPPFAGIVAADVTACAPHPNASRLQVAQVSDGKKTYQVVCGGTNCRAGIRVPFAVPGAVLTGEDGKPFRIEETKLRGVVSSGMICSAEELHLTGGDPGTIMELPSEIDLGKDLVLLLWDPVFEISLTPNLGHCFSALGIARELSAALQIPLHYPHFSTPHTQTKVQAKIAVSIKTDLCKRYMGRWIEGAKIAPSPFWLQKLLLAAGMKPISNAVDIANYMLLKWGQPMHAFDGEKIEGEVHVTTTQGKFLGLDQIEREVLPGTLAIADAKKTIALAGIMGSADSAVSPTTTQIFLECAVFDPLAIRKAARALSLRTESAQRFERGVDPVGCAAALEEACHWMTELTGGTLTSGIIDLKQDSFAPKKIPYRVQRINGLLGLKLSQSEIEGIFHRLGFRSLVTQTDHQVEVPLFRSDITAEIDLVEEIARIYGYNHIPRHAVRCTTSSLSQDPMYLFENQFRNGCVKLGLQEFLHADLISPKIAQIFGHQLLKTIHSKSEDYSLLRASLLPGHLQSTKHNFDHKTFSFGAFEIGRIHLAQGEMTMGALLLTGNSTPSHWSAQPRSYDFYDLKGMLENLFSHLHLPIPSFVSSQHPHFHPGRQAEFFCNERSLGLMGELHPSLLEKFDLHRPIFFAEFHLETALSLQKKFQRMIPLPQFPASERDWTIFLPLETEMESLFQKIKTSPTPLLAKAELIDLYYPEGMNQKNATFRFTYCDPLKTLSFEEVETAHHNLLAQIAQ